MIAYEILTGERPFAGEHLSTIVYKIVAEEPPNAHRLNGTLTEQIDAVLRRALAKKPEERFPHCSSFVGALEIACAESRGWKTLPAGASASMPTIAVEPPAEAPAPPPVTARPPAPTRIVPMPVFPERGEAPPPPVREPINLPSFERGPEPVRRQRVLLPVLMSVLVVAGLAAIFVYQSGLVGQSGTASQSASSPRTETTPPAPQPLPAAQPSAPQPAPEAQAEKKPSPVPSEPADSGTADAPRAETAPEPEPRETARIPSTRGLHDVWVTTSPPGAKAVLDGNLDQACRTPCMLHGPAGTHQLTVSQAGYLNEYREVRVGDTAVDVPPISLRQPASTLMISSYPAGASVRINGQSMPQQTPAVFTLKPGTYSVTVEKNGVTKTWDAVRLGEELVHLSVALNQ